MCTPRSKTTKESLNFPSTKTNMSPLKKGQDPKRKSHLQTSHFPGAYVSFREDGFSLPNWVVLQVSSHLKFSESNCNLAMVVKIRFWFKRTPQANIKVRLRNLGLPSHAGSPSVAFFLGKLEMFEMLHGKIDPTNTEIKAPSWLKT